MDKYGKASNIAVKYIARSKGLSPKVAWNRAIAEIFDSPTSRNKGCPRGAFLALCQHGLVKGVPRGEYTKSIENKKYALDAVSELKKNPDLCKDKKRLWQTIQRGTDKTHNSQMDVVITLWQNGAINLKSV